MVEQKYIHSFWKNVDKKDENSCWEWTASLQKSGYGNSYSENGVETAHRISYKINKGEIPKGKLIMHSCDNKRCVNPNHLLLGNQIKNMKDCSNKDRLNPKSVQNLRKGRRFQKGHIPWIKGRRDVILFCKNCNKKILTIESRMKQFCGYSCSSLHREKIKRIKRLEL